MSNGNWWYGALYGGVKIEMQKIFEFLVTVLTIKRDSDIY